MNQRQPPHLPVGVRRALHCISLLLLPAMSPGGAQALTRPRPLPDGSASGGVDTPYLPALGAVPLRFQEAMPPPDLTTRPAAAAPPVPALSLTESSVAMANTAAMRPSAPSREPVATAAKTPVTEPVPAPAKPPPAILQDDINQPVKAEDFLPFFQLPGSAKSTGEVNVIVPAPRQAPANAVVPPSSATYTQSPR